MPSRATAAKLKNLQQQCSQLEEELEAEQRKNTTLVSKHLLLKGICDGLSLYLGAKAQLFLPDHDASTSSRYEQRSAELKRLEDDLLQVLGTASSPLLHAPEAALCSSMGGVCDTIAPRYDPLAFFKFHVAQPPLPNASTLTSKDVACVLRATVLESSVLLHTLQHSLSLDQPVAADNKDHTTNATSVTSSSCSSSPMEALAALWNRYLHMLLSVMLSGRSNVVQSVTLYDLSTLQLDPNIPARQALKAAALPPLLGLSPSQLREVTEGVPVFKELLSGVLHEQQVLGAGELAAERATAGCSSGNTTGWDLEGYEQSTCRMQALLHKEYVLRAAALGWWLGTLTWRQVALAASLSWPLPIGPWQLALAIEQYARQQLQQPSHQSAQQQEQQQSQEQEKQLQEQSPQHQRQLQPKQELE